MNNGLKVSCIRIAQSLANEMEHSWKHVSFICNKNSIISLGWNQPFKTHPLAHKYGYRYNAIHSELHCILNFEKPIRELYKYTLVNVRIDKFNHPRLSRPCKICQIVLNSFGIDEVWYTDRSGNFRRF